MGRNYISQVDPFNSGFTLSPYVHLYHALVAMVKLVTGYGIPFGNAYLVPC